LPTMSQPRRGIVLRRAAWAVVALTLVVAACGDEDPLVATVNGEPITLGNIQALHPFEEPELGGPDFAIVLRDSIVQEIVVQAAREEFGLERDESEVVARLEELRADIEASGATWESFLEAQGRTEAEMQELAFQLVLKQQIEDRLIADVVPLTEAELRAEYDQQLQWLAQVCVRHILVETGPEAEAALDRLGEGLPPMEGTWDVLPPPATWRSLPQQPSRGPSTSRSGPSRRGSAFTSSWWSRGPFPRSTRRFR